MEMSQLEIRQVTEPGDPAIRGFGRLQERTFPDPDLLIPPAVFPRMLTTRTAERRNFLLVAEAEGEVVGGTLFHYFPRPNTGFSSSLAVTPAARGRGVARELHLARFALLDREAGAKAPVHGLFIDVAAPERLSPAELEQERLVGADPVARRRILQALGFRRVDVAYCQPAGGPGEEPITTMDLLYCPRVPAQSVPADRIAQTMHAYWRPWLGQPVADREAYALRQRCGGPEVPLRHA